MTASEPLADVVRLACHDLRTPLATISGFAKTMVRAGTLPEREGRFVAMIDEASGQMNELIALLSLAAALASGRYEPQLAETETLDLVEAAAGEQITVEGRGAVVRTDRELVRQALVALADAALRHGQVERAGWRVEGLELVLAPVEPQAAAVLDGSAPRDLGALVARLALETVGGSLAIDGGTLRVRL